MVKAVFMDVYGLNPIKVMDYAHAKTMHKKLVLVSVELSIIAAIKSITAKNVKAVKVHIGKQTTLFLKVEGIVKDFPPGLAKEVQRVTKM